MEDINNDKSYKFEEKDNKYIFTSTVNYPNNRTLINQKVYFDYISCRSRVFAAWHHQFISVFGWAIKRW